MFAVLSALPIHIKMSFEHSAGGDLDFFLYFILEELDCIFLMIALTLLIKVVFKRVGDVRTCCVGMASCKEIITTGGITYFINSIYAHVDVELNGNSEI